MAVGTTAMLLTMVPYLFGLSIANNRHFMWLGYNFDDSCVYLSWMRQAANGSHRVYNLFTTEPQNGLIPNPLYFCLGSAAKLFHIPLIYMQHVARILFGAVLLALAWRLILRTVCASRARRLAFLFLCFGSGLGWLPGLWPAPIDAWQPEAVTFLSLYLSPLFCFSLALQVLSALFFLSAIETGKARFALYTGLVVFILGLTHTYDVVTMLAVFGAIAATLTVAKALKRSPHPGTQSSSPLPASRTLAPNSGIFALWLFVAITAITSAPAAAFIYLELQRENVFHKRMEVKTASHEFYLLLLGYGLLLVFAVFGAVKTFGSTGNGSIAAPDQKTNGKCTDDSLSRPTLPVVYLAAWMVANIAVSYLPINPFTFQRKMLQGAHIPIAILAGIGASMLIRRLPALKSNFRFAAAALFLTLVLSLSNVMFVMRDIDSYTSDLIMTTHMHRPYISNGEMQALEWVRVNTPEDAAIQPMPWLVGGGGHLAPADMTLACIAPGLTGRHVYCGHWGETPDYAAELAELGRFGLPAPVMSDEMRIDLLRRMKVSYLIFSQKQPGTDTLGQSADDLMPMFRGLLPVPPYLSLAYSNADADVYKVQLP